MPGKKKKKKWKRKNERKRGRDGGKFTLTWLNLKDFISFVKIVKLICRGFRRLKFKIEFVSSHKFIEKNLNGNAILKILNCVLKLCILT